MAPEPLSAQSKLASRDTSDESDVNGVPLPPDGILFMNKTAKGGVQQGTSQVRLLMESGVNVRTGTLLDVGCGWGRLAYGLLSTGFDGRYIGVDIVRERTDWLEANFTSVHPRYSFHFLDIKNDLYNPNGRLTRISYDALISDAAPTTIVLLSVFTHMYEADIAHYLIDLATIMSSDSTLVFSCLLFDGVAQERIRQGVASRKFPYKLSADCRYDLKSEPLGAIAYTEPKILQLLGRAGLAGRVIRGNWSRAKADRKGSWGQDVIIAKKAEHGATGPVDPADERKAKDRRGPGFHDRMAAWRRWITSSMTPPIPFPRRKAVH